VSDTKVKKFRAFSFSFFGFSVKAKREDGGEEEDYS
jgi:hypothetical protein